MKLYAATALLAVLNLLIPACSNAPGAGPIDGSFAITSTKCNGVAQTITTAQVIAIANLAGTVVITDGSCTETDTEIFSYPAADQIGMQQAGVACSASCTSGQCMASSTVQTTPTVYTFALSGTTLTFTRTSASNDEDCPTGEATEITLTKQ